MDTKFPGLLLNAKNEQLILSCC